MARGRSEDPMGWWGVPQWMEKTAAAGEAIPTDVDPSLYDVYGPSRRLAQTEIGRGGSALDQKLRTLAWRGRMGQSSGASAQIAGAQLQNRANILDRLLGVEKEQVGMNIAREAEGYRRKAAKYDVLRGITGMYGGAASQDMAAEEANRQRTAERKAGQAGLAWDIGKTLIGGGMMAFGGPAIAGVGSALLGIPSTGGGYSTRSGSVNMQGPTPGGVIADYGQFGSGFNSSNGMPVPYGEQYYARGGSTTARRMFIGDARRRGIPNPELVLNPTGAPLTIVPVSNAEVDRRTGKKYACGTKMKKYALGTMSGGRSAQRAQKWAGAVKGGGTGRYGMPQGRHGYKGGEKSATNH
ncbi:MAG: hypothetical protein WC551_10590 [Patescibacteria group bacterium]